MNIYARFFDHDILAHSAEELFDFLGSLQGITLTDHLVADIRSYINGDMPYPKRYKVRPRIYFILIKTQAESMEEFKSHRKDDSTEPRPARSEEQSKAREVRLLALAEPRRGWYFGRILFKRVLPIPGTGKFQYQDTDFQAYILAESGQDCYNRIVNHLKNRPDIDMRSQFPSTRGTNFEFRYLGETLSDGSKLNTEEVVSESTPDEASSNSRDDVPEASEAEKQ